MARLTRRERNREREREKKSALGYEGVKFRHDLCPDLPEEREKKSERKKKCIRI